MMNRTVFFIIFVFSLFSSREMFAGDPKMTCNSFKNPQMLDGWIGKTGRKDSGIFGISLTSAAIPLTGTKSTPSNSGFCNPTPGFPDTTKTRFTVFQSGIGGDNGYDPMLRGDGPPCLPRLPVCPSGFNYSIRLGNACFSSEAEGLFLTMPITTENALLYIHFAIVLEYINHSDEDNPEFIIRVRNRNGELIDPCTEMRTSSFRVAGTPGWYLCKTGGQEIAYTDWRKVAINLSRYLGEEVTIEILTGDCQPSGHFGYAYVVGECSPMKLSSTAGCDSVSLDLVTSITAPDGLNSYEWYSGISSDPSTWELIDDTSRVHKQILKVYRSDMHGDISRDFICKVKSYMNEKIPCEAELFITVKDLRPIVKIDKTILCENTLKLYNNSFTPEFSGLTPELLDSTATRWELGDGTTIINQHDSLMHQYLTTGLKTISLTVQTLGTKCKGRATSIVKLNDYVRSLFSTDKMAYCIHDTAVLTGSNATEFTWIFGNDTLRGSRVSRVLGFADSSFQLIGKIGDCYGDTTGSIPILPYPKINFNGDPNICLGEQTNIRVSSSNGTQYAWSKSRTGSPILEASQLLRIKPEETTVFFATAINDHGCKSLDSLSIRVLSPSLSADTLRICPGAAITFLASSTEPDNLERFQWRALPENWALNPGGGYQEKLVVRPSETTDYFLTAVGKNGCYSKEVAQRVWVYPYPISKIEVRPDFIDIEEPIIQLKDHSENGLTSLWKMGDGSSSTEGDFTYEYGPSSLQKGMVEIELISFNELFCTDTAKLTLPIRIFSAVAPNAFTPEAEENKLFFLQTKGNLEDYHLQIYNRWGELVFASDDPLRGWDGRVKNRKAPSGTYVWVVSFRRAENNRTYTEKGAVTLIR